MMARILLKKSTKKRKILHTILIFYCTKVFHKALLFLININYMRKKSTKVPKCDICPLLAIAQKMIQADESIKKNMIIIMKHQLFEIRNHNLN